MSLKYTVFAVGAGLLLASFGVNAQQYKVTNLGTLGGTSSQGNGINASGQVTGISYVEGNAIFHAFFYSNGKMTDLGTLGGASSSYGAGINASGQVTGSAATIHEFDAFLYSDGAMQDLGTLGGTASQGNSINASGQVAGYSYTAGNVVQHAFLYSNGAMQDLGTLGGTFSQSNGINDSGQVTGYSNVSGSGPPYHAFIYSNGTMQDLGTLGGISSQGNSINASGQVTGLSITTGNAAEHAFLYSNGTMQDLGTLGGGGSFGYGINVGGQVTGSSQPSANSAYHAFLYSNGQMSDLNSLISSTAASRYTLTSGVAINDSGQIVVNGTVNATGQNVALLLTPTAIPTTTSLVSSASSSTYGTSVTLTALVTPSIGSTPVGNVKFYAGAVHLGTVTLNGAGQAILTTSAIPVGAQSLTATYAGNPTDLTSTSSAVEIAVSAVATTTTLVASPTTGAPGTSITLTVTVNPMSGTAIPRGKVTFKDGATTLAVVELNESGVATYVTTTLGAGTHRLTAHYGGNADEVKSVSAAVTVTIT